MAIVDLSKFGQFFEIRGKFHRDKTIYPKYPYKGGGFLPDLEDGIYQMPRYSFGRVCRRIDFYDYVITHTEAQQTQRQKYYACFPQWNNLTEAQKAVYKKRSQRKNMTGYNLFMKECLNG